MLPTTNSSTGLFDGVPVPISDCPADIVPAGCEVVIGFDPATGDSVTGFYDPSTGITHIQCFSQGGNNPRQP